MLRTLGLDRLKEKVEQEHFQHHYVVERALAKKLKHLASYCLF